MVVGGTVTGTLYSACLQCMAPRPSGELTTSPRASPEDGRLLNLASWGSLRQTAVTSVSCASSPWASGTGDETMIVTPTSEFGVHSASLCYDFAL